MRRYFAHALRIQSDWALPDGVLSGTEGPFDLLFERSESALPNMGDGQGAYFRFGDGAHDYYWPELGTISVQRSGRVAIYEKADAPTGLVPHVLLGPVMGDWLMHAGKLPLHSNCIEFDGAALAVVGPSGAGKSTLGAALTLAGGSTHGDDLVGIDPDTTLVPFGTARTKLNPDVLGQLGIDQAPLPRVYSTIDKRSVVVGETPAAAPPELPLRAIYRLVDSEQDEPEFEKLDVFQSALGILGDVFHLELQTKAVGAPGLLQMTSRIAEKVPLYLLRRKRKLTSLNSLAGQVRDHFLRHHRA